MLPLKLYNFEEHMLLKTTLDEAWSFFSDPRNLPKITPPSLGFRFLSNPPPETYAGLIIHYSVSPLLGVPLQWVTEISHCIEREMFVDEQRFGPYRFWHHQHRFSETPDGVVMQDTVHYALYGDPFSRPIHQLVVRPQVEAIFKFRKEALKEFFQIG